MIESVYGSITAVGFESGHRFVIGHWLKSPIGTFADVMWADPDGNKVLVADPEAAEYVTSVYPFAEVVVQPVALQARGRTLTVAAGIVHLEVELSRYCFRFPPRPRWFTATVENQISRVLLGVQTYGISPTGAIEWYRTKSLRWVVAASGSIKTTGDSQSAELTESADIAINTGLGAMANLKRPIGFGFTDPPQRPSQTVLRVDIKKYSK